MTQALTAMVSAERVDASTRNPREQRDPSVLPAVPRGQLPADLIAVPLGSDQFSSSLKICILCRKTPDPVQRFLLMRRDTLDARIYLGCITDSFGVLEFVDIWVQSLDGLADAAKASILCNDAVNNTSVDERWKSLFEASSESWPAAFIATGYEKFNPRPLFLDPQQGIPVHPEGWELCKDDELLRAAELPRYSSTLFRYLYRPNGASGDRKFVPLSADCPRKKNIVEYETILPNYKQLVPVNPGGGLLLIKPAGNLNLQEINELLGGKRYDGVAYGKSRLRFGRLQCLSSFSGGFIFPGEPQTNASRFVETYLLKLNLFAGMVEEVGRFTHATSRPLLNLKPSSFSVQLEDSSMHLPAFWGSRVLLTDPGDAIPITMPQGDTNFYYCLPGSSVKFGIYQPDIVPRGSVQGFGELFLSGGVDTPQGRVFEGMLTVSDPIRPTAKDLFRIRVPIPDKRVDLYAKVDPLASPSQSVLKFRSVPDDRSKPFLPDLLARVGVPMQQASFEFFPLFSSACDLYSLAVLAVDTLLTRPESNHAEQLSAIRTLATRCRETTGKPLEQRIAAIFAEKGDWHEVLGPQMLLGAKMDAQLALRFVTPELWWSTLSLIISMFPGQGRDSLLADFGDMVQGRMHGVYQTVMQDINRLTHRARSLLFGEWGVNRQLGLLLEEFRGPRAGS